MSLRLDVRVEGEDVQLILYEEKLVVMLAPPEAASLGHSLVRAADAVYEDEEGVAA